MMKRKILPLFIFVLTASTILAQVNITFEINTATIPSVDAAGMFIAGGTGFIGNELVPHFEKLNHEVLVLGRTKIDKPNYHQWDGKTLGEWKYELKGTDVLINLTGKSVDCRYTEKNKKEIFDSRTNSIEVLEKAFNEIN